MPPFCLLNQRRWVTTNALFAILHNSTSLMLIYCRHKSKCRNVNYTTESQNFYSIKFRSWVLAAEREVQFRGTSCETGSGQRAMDQFSCYSALPLQILIMATTAPERYESPDQAAQCQTARLSFISDSALGWTHLDVKFYDVKMFQT
jgi:hypothetical protein